MALVVKDPPKAKPPSDKNPETLAEAIKNDHVPNGFSFRRSVEKYVVDKQKNEPKIIKHLSPSQMGKCARAHIWKVRQFLPSTPPTVDALINFQIGFAWEDIIEKAIQAEGVPYRRGVKIHNEALNVAGEIDFIVMQNGGEIDADSKTMRSEWFWFLANTNKDFLKTNDSYVQQLGTYCLLRKLEGHNPLYGQFPFISKNDGMIWREIRSPLDPELEARLYARIEYLNGFLKSGKLPPCECEGWNVGYCDFGNPATRAKNGKGKMLSTECCQEKADGSPAWDVPVDWYPEYK